MIIKYLIKTNQFIILDQGELVKKEIQMILIELRASTQTLRKNIYQ